MFHSPLTKRRLLIPRWRTLQMTLRTMELAAPKPTGSLNRALTGSARVQDKLANWTLNPNVISAGELVEAALVEAKERVAFDAARYLLSRASSATPLLRKLATSTLERGANLENTTVPPRPDPKVQKTLWRQRTRRHPANALAWVELSLYEIITGKKKAASKCMAVALQLAPNDRHVLRSASRLFLHLGDAQKAYDIIASSDAVSGDPWLIAAELSLAELAARHPRFVRAGREIVADGGLLPRQITELAGAIATLELTANHKRKAKRYFSWSIADPTGSALAQAEWASSLLGIELVDKSHLKKVAEPNEAKVFHLLREEQFKKIPNLCAQWLAEEPYAVRPREIASVVTSMTGDHEKTLELTSRALRLHPNSNVILNNRAFALAHLGKLDEARKVLDRVNVADNGLSPLVTEANLGLVAMRQGNDEAGVRHYLRAIGGFHKMNARRSVNVAHIFFAREAALAGLKDSEKLVKRARAARASLNTSVHDHVVQQAEDALANIKRQKGNQNGAWGR